MPPLPSRFGKLTYRFYRWLDKLTYQLSLPAPLSRKGRRRPNVIGPIQPRLEHLEPIILLGTAPK